MKAKFKCLNCNLEFELDKYTATCLACNHKYVKWVNYEKVMQKLEKKKDKK